MRLCPGEFGETRVRMNFVGTLFEGAPLQLMKVKTFCLGVQVVRVWNVILVWNIGVFVNEVVAETGG